MAGSVNKVILVGNLGRDPEIRRTAQGEPVASLRVATSETWRDKGSGERRERTEWHSVVVFNENLARFAEQYLRKGMKVYLEGQMQTRKWQDQQGVEKYTTEVVLQRFRGELTSLEKVEREAPDPDAYGSTRTREPAGNSYAAAKEGRSPPPSTGAAIDDDIPF